MVCSPYLVCIFKDLKKYQHQIKTEMWWTYILKYYTYIYFHNNNINNHPLSTQMLKCNSNNCTRLTSLLSSHLHFEVIFLDFSDIHFKSTWFYILTYALIVYIIIYSSAQFHGQCLEPYYMKNSPARRDMFEYGRWFGDISWKKYPYIILLLQITKIKGRQILFLGGWALDIILKVRR